MFLELCHTHKPHMHTCTHVHSGAHTHIHTHAHAHAAHFAQMCVNGGQAQGFALFATPWHAVQAQEAIAGTPFELAPPAAAHAAPAVPITEGADSSPAALAGGTLDPQAGLTEQQHQQQALAAGVSTMVRSAGAEGDEAGAQALLEERASQGGPVVADAVMAEGRLKEGAEDSKSRGAASDAGRCAHGLCVHARALLQCVCAPIDRSSLQACACAGRVGLCGCCCYGPPQCTHLSSLVRASAAHAATPKGWLPPSCSRLSQLPLLAHFFVGVCSVALAPVVPRWVHAHAACVPKPHQRDHGAPKASYPCLRELAARTLYATCMQAGEQAVPAHLSTALRDRAQEPAR